ncbi:hypothetical protein P2H44_03370 [Albimonas sp. CAU 1670]|uniref:hypothetical protein n=1 Tax=Albimonas sp. CAU 1670 TaxID=3032599 RepID=UPI0023DC1C47|nr:hypothetical protein [Albimonas sp. CAU 1670]MDF2231584.1 hypothetical protein [Albimonas sp. CAU 1670]
MADVYVQFVGADGCYRMAGVRVRCAPGNGVGSLRDEAERGVVTPLAEEGDREIVAGLAGRDLRPFVEKLPVAKAIPRS